MAAENDAKNCSVVELRQYTLRPGARDALVDVFDRELVETQEAVGMTVLGQFRDLRNPDRFVWLRGFAGMDDRRRALQAFYSGPVWAAHGPEANRTMLEWHDVLLLRPAWAGSGVVPAGNRPPRETAGDASGLVDITVFPLRGPATPELITLARGTLSACLASGGAQQVAWYVSELTPNDFPRLPVREGENVLVGVALFADPGAFDRFVHDGTWERDAAPLLAPSVRATDVAAAGADSPVGTPPRAAGLTRVRWRGRKVHPRSARPTARGRSGFQRCRSPRLQVTRSAGGDAPAAGDPAGRRPRLAETSRDSRGRPFA